MDAGWLRIFAATPQPLSRTPAALSPARLALLCPLQTAPAAVPPAVGAELDPKVFEPVLPGPLRPVPSKERLSLKAQVIFETSWKKIEAKYKEVGRGRAVETQHWTQLT